VSELARYHVRTPTGYWLATGAIFAFCLVVIAATVIFGDVPPLMLLLFAGLCSAAIASAVSMNAYRVGGGRNLIRFYPDRIEVPAVRERAPMRFARDGLTARVEDVKVAYRFAFAKVATMNRGKLIELRAGDLRRKLSTLILEDPADERFLIADLERFLAGKPALGRAAQEASPPPRTEYDDRLDRELADLK
jgi:hypothetical protein